MTSNVEYLGKLRTRCTHSASGATFETDAPVDNHGMGALFSPTDTTATSLASCMITVMGIKAAKEQITFANLKADVQKLMNAEPRRIRKIVVKLYIGEQWNEQEKAIMEETAKTCPVALSLHPDIIQDIQFIYTSSGS